MVEAASYLNMSSVFHLRLVLVSAMIPAYLAHTVVV